MKKASIIFAAIAVSVIGIMGIVAHSYAIPYPTGVGGTGTSITPASGTIPIGNGSGSYTPAFITPGANIQITNGSGTVTIAVTGTATGTVYLLQSGHGISLSPSSITSSGTIAVNTSTVIADVVASGQFLPSSTLYVASVNGLSGAVTIGIPATTTINAAQATVFRLIGDGTTVTSTVNGATTTFSVLPNVFYPYGSNPANYLTGNQTITIVAAGDATGTASGATLITHTITVTGLQGKSLPALATGTLKYTGGAWTFDGNTYLVSGLNVTTTAPLGGGGALTSAGLTLTCATCLTANQTITLTGAVTGSGATSIATTYTTSTLYALFSGAAPITFNTSTGAIGWTNSLGYITAVTVNGQSGTSFNIVAGQGVTSTVSGATTTITLNLGPGCSGGNFVQTISPTGTISCATPAVGASSTNVYGTNGVTVVQVGVNATASLDTTYAAIWTALETFQKGLTANGTTTLASTTNALLLTNASGTVLGYAGSNPCGANQFAVSISATGTIACANGVTSVNGSNGAITITSSSLGVIYNPNWLTAAVTSINGATSTSHNDVAGTGISITSTSTSSNSTTTFTNTGVTSFTGQGCVTAANSTGTVALTVTCISGNQTITFTINGDATGTASGATSITDSITVTGLNGKALPANTTGTLEYTGGAWAIKLATSSLGLYDANGALSSYLGSTCSGGQYVTGFSATGTVACGTPAGTGGGVSTSTPNTWSAQQTFNSSTVTTGIINTGNTTSTSFTAGSGGFIASATSTLNYFANNNTTLGAATSSAIDYGAYLNSLCTYSLTVASGSLIVVPQTTQTFSTPLVENGRCTFQAPGGNATILNWNGAAGTSMITMQFPSTPHVQGGGFLGFTFNNLGSATTTNPIVAITQSGGATSTSLGGAHSYIAGNTFIGFGIAILNATGTYDTVIERNTFRGNGQAFKANVNSNSGEAWRLMNNWVVDEAFNALNCIQLADNSTEVGFMTDNVTDNCAVNFGAANTVVVNGNQTENAGGTENAYTIFTQGSSQTGDLSMSGIRVWNDGSLASTTYTGVFSISGNANITGVEVGSGASSTPNLFSTVGANSNIQISNVVNEAGTAFTAWGTGNWATIPTTTFNGTVYAFHGGAPVIVGANASGQLSIQGQSLFSATATFQGNISSTITSALISAGLNGVFAGYAGSNCTNQGVTGISASGTVTCATFATSTSGSSGANPTAVVGTSAVNGSASTFMRSDGAPAIDQTAAFSFSGLGNTTSTANISAASILASTTLKVNGTSTILGLAMFGTSTAPSSLSQLYVSSPSSGTIPIYFTSNNCTTGGADWIFGNDQFGDQFYIDNCGSLNDAAAAIGHSISANGNAAGLLVAPANAGSDAINASGTVMIGSGTATSSIGLTVENASSTIQIGTGTTNPGCIEMWSGSTKVYITATSISALTVTSTKPTACK